MVLLHQQILSTINSLKAGNVELVLVLVWGVGHSLSGQHSDITQKYIEQLEVLTFDVKDDHSLHSDRLLIVTINSLLKIGIKYKQFIARVVLLYHKIAATPGLKHNVLQQVR